MLTLLLFAALAALVVLLWNRFFQRIPLRAALLFWVVCAAYQAPTLFTSRVDLPGNLAFVAQPWQSTGAHPVKANTGIVFTQIAPWTQVARQSLLHGELPLWNRFVASGAPLLANQQTAIFHPFTLIGLLLPLGKAFTLSASLRLFTVALFTFALLRGFGVGAAAAIFGALAYTFCTFHVIWLLFPLGLATMMLPLCLAAVQEMTRAPRPSAYLLLVTALSLAVLGGHPESALWVWIVTAAFAAVELLRRPGALAVTASAFVVAMALTAFFWLPTLRALKVTSRYGLMESKAANPANHGLSAEWLLPLLTPNVLGNPANGTYAPPRGSHPAVLNDYGEVASSYAGLITLALALSAPFVARRRALWFALGCMLFALLTIAEAPLWRDLIRALPLAGIAINQRLRIVWDLGVCIAAAVAVDGALRANRFRALLWSLLTTAVAFAAIYAVRRPAFLFADPLATAQALTPLITAGLLVATLIRSPRRTPLVAAALVLCDLVVATWHYNPPARAEDVYPEGGAIRAMQQVPQPARIVAAGWSLLPDTPAAYLLEDVKTTDPIQHARYMTLLREQLDVDPATYDLLVRDFSRPFFDFLGIRSIYVPPGQSASGRNLHERYRGHDGTVLENDHALPRAFLVNRFRVEGDFDTTRAALKEIADLRELAVVDHIPDRVRAAAPELATRPAAESATARGAVSLARYARNATELDVDSNGWNLLVTSDVNWPGWRAYWNGRRLPPVTVNGAFLGCFVPPGHGRLLLRYRPAEFDSGIRIGAIALLALALAMPLWSRRRVQMNRAAQERSTGSL